MTDLFEFLKHLFSGLDRQRVWLAGGIVRDLLQNQRGTDIDLAAALEPCQMAALGFRLVNGKSTAPIWFRHDESFGNIEVTLLADLGERMADLSRRDFTINAMAMTLDGDLIDPLNGRDDLIHRRLRACSASCFHDDPLRLFRAFRFAGDGWALDQGTSSHIREVSWPDRLPDIPVERFSREMLKALQTARPERFFQLMLEFDAGQTFLPEIFSMPQIPAGPAIHHPEGDLFTHSLEVLQRAAAKTADPLTRFCALFHDLGKLATSPDLYPKHHGHDLAGYDMATEFCRRLRLPAQYGRALAWVSRLHGKFNTWTELRDSTKLRMADQAIRAGIVDCLPLVSLADKPGGTEPAEWRRVVEIAGMAAKELGINSDVLSRLIPDARGDAILQARITRLRSTRTSCS